MSSTTPYCPVERRHGRLYSWRPGVWRCMHEDHGGNGRSFTDKEASGDYQLKESDVTAIYERSAREVIAGRVRIEAAVKDIAAQLGRPSTQVREALNTMIDTLTVKEEQRVGDKASKSVKRAVAAKAQVERKKPERVSGATFAALRDELSLSNKQAAEATGEAGLGKSATYIYILTHDGASPDLFGKYEAALRAYAERKAGEAEASSEAEGEQALAEA